MAQTSIALLASGLAGAYLLGAIVLFFVGRRANRLANIYFAGLLAALGLFNIGQGLEYAVGDAISSAFYILEWGTYPLFPGLLWLGVAHYVTPGRLARRADGLWLLPLLASGLIYYWDMNSMDVPQDIPWFALLPDASTLDLLAESVALGLTGIACGSALWRIQRHGIAIARLRSDAETVDLKWLRNFLWGIPPLLLVWGLWLLSFETWLGYTLELMQFGAQAYFLVHALRQPEVFAFAPRQMAQVQVVIESPLDEASVAVESSLLPDDEVAILASALDDYMRTSEAFRKPDLSLLDLAEAISVRPQVMTFLLQRAFRQNFYAYVNAERVRFAERLMLDEAYAHYAIAAIGQEAGFKSRSTFYKAFGEATGLTPAAYKANHCWPHRTKSEAEAENDASKLLKTGDAEAL